MKPADETDARCKYVAGFNECTAQVTQYLTSLSSSDVTAGASANVTDDIQCCLLDHLANSLHQVTTTSKPHATVDQSASSPAVYVINQPQVPVTSSTSPAHLRVMPATLSSGQLVLLLASSPVQHQQELKIGDSDTVSGCTGDEILRDCTAVKCDADNQSESLPVARDVQRNADDLNMWRPW